MTQPLTTTDLEELLEREIRCCGSRQPAIAHTCDRPAVLAAHSGHGCKTGEAPFKCLPCWQQWYSYQSHVLAKYGFLICTHCDRRLPSVEAFSDYRPF